MSLIEQNNNISLDLNIKLSHDVVREYLKQKTNEESKIKLNDNQAESNKQRFSFSVDSLLNNKNNNSLTNSVNTATDYEEDFNNEIEDDEDKKRCTSSASFSDYSEENSNSELKITNSSSPKLNLNNLKGLHNFNELNTEDNDRKSINHHLNQFQTANSLLQNNLVQQHSN